MKSAIVLALVSTIASSLIVDASSLTPPVLPLIVRNPYLSTWLVNAREPPWTHWPIFWTGQELGFSVLASVSDSGTVYPLLGRPQDSLLPLRPSDNYTVSYPSYLGAQYDASTTNLSYSIPSPLGASSEPAELVISFLSPITPTSTMRQSIPASYMTVYLTGDFDINLYVDLNGQWVSGNRGSIIQWAFEATGVGLNSWRFKRETELLFTESYDRAEWGEVFFSASSNLRYESGTSAILRQQFATTGTLQNKVDGKFRSIQDAEPVFAFSKTFVLNSTNSTRVRKSDCVMFSIAHIQDPVVQFAAARGLTLMRPLWASWYPSYKDLLMFHYLDIDNVKSLAANYSLQLEKDAYKSGASDYVDIVALSARQVMGATSFAGTPDDPLLFLKEISSDGNTQTIDVIFPAFPFFLYTNPRWLSYLLEPLIEHMLSGQYPNTYAMHDLGTHFPNATGHPQGKDEYMPVEECGNILLMGLAVVNSLLYQENDEAQSLWSTLGTETAMDESMSPFALPPSLETRDGIDGLDDRWGGSVLGFEKARHWIERSYPLWKQWTGYLIDFSLYPQNQLSTDDFAGWLALQTNLALKGILGIKAMSELARIINVPSDVSYYANISTAYIYQWEKCGISRDHTHAKLSYDWYGSWTTLYNLYADSLLCFRLGGSTASRQVLPAYPHVGGGQTPIKPPSSNESQGFVPARIYSMQSHWYLMVRQHYGVPLDSRHLYTKSDWEFFTMAVASNKTRSIILESVARWVNETSTNRPLTDLYATEGTGGFPGINFFARPVVGGHFAFLALGRACGGKAMDGLKFLDEGDDERRHHGGHQCDMATCALERGDGASKWPNIDNGFTKKAKEGMKSIKQTVMSFLGGGEL